MQYRQTREQQSTLPSFSDVEFSCYSQNGEDGILLYIFGLIGFESRRSVEICAGDGIECNTANLLINHGFTGLLVDGNAALVESGKAFYAQQRQTHLWPPTFIEAWVTRENVNDIVQRSGITGEIDVLSLDLDGMDYWVWKDLVCIQPRVVVLEYNNLWPAEHAVAVPYRSGFHASFSDIGLDYGGASLGAFVKLARSKGYRLVGCQRYGFNAFFVRADLGVDVLPEIDPAACLKHPFVLHAQAQRLPRVEDLEWVRV